MVLDIHGIQKSFVFQKVLISTFNTSFFVNSQAYINQKVVLYRKTVIKRELLRFLIHKYKSDSNMFKHLNFKAKNPPSEYNTNF